MNPLTNIKNVQKLNERELELGIIGKKSWHDEYKDSAWIFIGGLPFDLTEGDIICVFSQYGEIVNINLVRDHKSGKSKGFAFLCYEDQRSTVLAVDNLNGIKILGRTIRVDHVKDYKVPKEHGDEDDLTKQIRADGCAPKVDSSSSSEEEKKQKEQKKAKKMKKKKRKSFSPSLEEVKVEIKKEKFDPGYDLSQNGTHDRANRLARPYPDRGSVDRDRSDRSVRPYTDRTLGHNRVDRLGRPNPGETLDNERVDRLDRQYEERALSRSEEGSYRDRESSSSSRGKHYHESGRRNRRGDSRERRGDSRERKGDSRERRRHSRERRDSRERRGDSRERQRRRHREYL